MSLWLVHSESFFTTPAGISSKGHLLVLTLDYLLLSIIDLSNPLMRDLLYPRFFDRVSYDHVTHYNFRSPPDLTPLTRD